MNWEIAGWLALAGSGTGIAAGCALQRGAGGRQAAARAVLELAWPVFFLSAMALLVITETITFPAVLMLATSITGAVWIADAAWLRARRRAGVAEPAVVEMAKSFFPVILVVFCLRSFLYEPFKIPSESMLPTLEVGDFILVDKFAYGIRLPVLNKTLIERGQPARGDVMVFRLPHDPGKDLIKRVVGLPGDRVAYRGKQLTINGLPDPAPRTLVNMQAASLNPAAVRDFPHRDQCRMAAGGFDCTVPAGHYFVMGDNRDNSDDSRYWGFVPDANIVGRARWVWMNIGSMERVGTAIR